MAAKNMGKQILGFSADSGNEFLRVHAKIQRKKCIEVFCVDQCESVDEEINDLVQTSDQIQKISLHDDSRTEQSEDLRDSRSRNDRDDEEISEEYFHHRQSKRYFIRFDKSDNLSDYEDENKIHEEESTSKSDSSSDKSKIEKIIKELIDTEGRYVDGLRTVIEEYTTLDFGEKKSCIFGNIEDIYEEAEKLLKLLKQNHNSTEEIAHVFINEEQAIFDMYRQYALNRSTSNAYLQEFSEIIKEKENQLQKLPLSHFLQTPLLRLAQYKTLLERMQKETKGLGTSINIAVEMINRGLEKANDIFKVGSMKYNDMDLYVQDAFIMKEDFNILKPRKFLSTVFLFENIIVFTEAHSKDAEYFEYVGSIKTNDLGLSAREHEDKIFHLTDHPNLKKPKGKVITFILEAKTEEIKNKWTKEIEAMLWRQVIIAKELQEYSNANR